MRRGMSVLLCLAMILTAATLSASALSSDVTADSWDDVELQAFICQQGEYFCSDMAEDFWNDEWWYQEIPELDNNEEMLACINVRGFAVSPDLKYAFLGHLNGGTGFRGCAMLDLATGAITDVYYHYEEENLDSSATRFSFPKGIGADDRGYVYVGFALSSNYNVVNLGIAQVNETEKTLDEVALVPVYEWGQPGDVGGIQIGVNGVDVARIGDRYYCYCMVNYAYDALVCYDVTDPANPVLNTEFGTNGAIIFTDDDCPVFPEGTRLEDGNFLDVDEDGTIWLCAKFKNGKYGVMKIAPDGSACAGSFETETSAFCVAHAGGYLIVGDKSGQSVDVYDDSSFEKVGSPKFDTDVYGHCFSMIQVIDDILIVDDGDNNDTSGYNAILVAPLTADAEVKLSEMVTTLNGGEEPESETETDEKTPDESQEPSSETATKDTTPDPSGEETNQDPSGEETTQPTAGESGTKAPGEGDTEATESTGCKSVVGGASAVLALGVAVCGVAVRKKKEQ